MDVGAYPLDSPAVIAHFGLHECSIVQCFVDMTHNA
jgi:hypothetical protein